MAANILATLYIIAMFCLLGTIMCGGLLFWFRKAVFNQLKLTKLMKLGYVICRLKRIDKTEKEMIAIPNKETNGVIFPGVEGTYILDDASVILKDRKWPVYEWREGDTAPLNYEKETISTNITCPHCNKQTDVTVQKPKSISPSVLDNLILKIKTLSQMLTIEKILLYMLLAAGALLIGLAIDGYLTYNLGEKILPQLLQQYCGKQVLNGTITL